MISQIFDRYRQLGKNGQDILWNVASYGVMGICGIALNFMITSQAGSAALGIFSQVYAIYIIVSQFSALGVHLSVLKTTSEYSNNRDVLPVILSSSLIASGLMALLTIAVMYLLRNLFSVWMDSPSVPEGLAWALPGLFFFTLNKVEFSFLNGLSRMKFYAVGQSLRYLLMILFAEAIILLDWNTDKLPLLFSASEFILFILLYSINKIKPIFILTKSFFEWFWFHIKFGSRGFMSNVLIGLNPRISILLLGIYCSDSAVGIFSMAEIASEGIYQLILVLRTNMNPTIVTMISKGQLDTLVHFSKRVMKSTYLFISLVCVLSICLYPIGLFFVKTQYDYFISWLLFIVITTGIGIGSGYIPFGNILLLAGHPGKHSLMISTQVLINLIGNLILIPVFGGFGAAIATSFSNIFYIFLVKVFARKILALQI